jgi:hypothetical protein
MPSASDPLPVSEHSSASTFTVRPGAEWNVGAERRHGHPVADVVEKMTRPEISDPR